ncbi:MAG: GNAT family N-acetyltransferase, partial [Vicinamibacterales bacterium]
AVAVELDLIVRAIETDRRNLALASERFQSTHAVFVRNRDVPDIYDCNHVCNVTASTPSEIDAFFEQMETEFAGFGHRRIEVDFRTPPALVARLALDGYKRDDALLFVLAGDLSGPAPIAHEIRPLESEADWSAYAALHELDWREYSERQNRKEPPDVGRQMIRAHRGRQPPVQYFLAYVDGNAVAYFNSWAGIDGVGQVEDLFTHPKYRNRGLARALIHHCVRDARAKGAGPVVIAADPNDTPKRIYAGMAFRPVAVLSHYTRKLHADTQR